MLMMAACSMATLAEPSGDDYRSGQVAPTTQAERQRLAKKMEQQRQREALALAEQESVARAEAERQAALRAQRSPGERLTESRCTPCHSLSVVILQPRGAVGWCWTIERMRWWHGAAIGRGEAAIIGRHLSAAQAVGPWRLALEWGVAAVVLGAVPAAVIGWFLRHRDRRKMSS